MTDYFPILQNNPLFHSVAHSDFSALLTCLGARERQYGKKDVILLAGDPVTFVGLVLEGGVTIRKESHQGQPLLLAEMGAGEIFGEVFACAQVFHSPVSIVASEPTRVLFLDYQKVITTCSNNCAFHQTLMKNMLRVLAYKNLGLNQKIELLSKRTLREKLLTYLELESRGAQAFTIPLNREELASYLCADRSALSNELSKMQRDGLITYQKNQFRWLK